MAAIRENSTDPNLPIFWSESSSQRRRSDPTSDTSRSEEDEDASGVSRHQCLRIVDKDETDFDIDRVR